MYDDREKAIRDRKWQLNAAFQEGFRIGKIRGQIKAKIKGEVEGTVELIRELQGQLRGLVSEEADLRAMTLEQLKAMASDLEERAGNRYFDFSRIPRI